MQERLMKLLLQYGKDEKFDLGIFYYSFRGAKFLTDQILSLIKEEIEKKREFIGVGKIPTSKSDWTERDRNFIKYGNNQCIDKIEKIYGG